MKGLVDSENNEKPPYDGDFDTPVKVTSAWKFNRCCLITSGIGCLLILVVVTVTSLQLALNAVHIESSLADADDICPIGKTVRPSSYLSNQSSVDYIVYDPDFRQLSATRLSRAVQIPTVIYDNPPSPQEDSKAYEEFDRFHEFLRREFPVVYDKLEVERINVHGLLLSWKGSDSSLKPSLLTGHIDVVPVAEGTRFKWKHDPFSGHFDGKNIWGRGSSDCKSLVIAILQSIERLIIDGFVPTRSLLVGFGFDEEVGGNLGAKAINDIILERYGSDSIYSIIDEGGSSITKIGDRVFALPSIGEKGSVNIEISLTTPGGHSSVPPEHTNIGLIAQLINEIERTPFEPIMDQVNRTLNYLQCLAKHSDKFDPELKASIFKAAYDKVSNAKVLKYLDSILDSKYLVRTTQAVDMINGGVKSNALPEFSQFVTNHRISVESPVNFTVNKILADVKTIANQFNLGVYLEEEEIIASTESGFFHVSPGQGLSPAAVTPVKGKTWEIFAGSIKHIIEDYIYPNLTEPAVVAGNLNTGNTDTHHYWGLTKNIYRYRLSTFSGIIEGGTHSVDEHTTIENQLYLIAFNYEYIKSVSEDLSHY